MTLRTSTSGPTLSMDTAVRRRRINVFTILLVLIALGPPALAISMLVPTSLLMDVLVMAECKVRSGKKVESDDDTHVHCRIVRVPGYGHLRTCCEHGWNCEALIEERLKQSRARIDRLNSLNQPLRTSRRL